ncbi:MAG: hypothetical protein HC903_05040 [Methylacidiphilales bacterium]|nr:hypothetical protein [Candidatus Methylacidiphilales bacterium]
MRVPGHSPSKYQHNSLSGNAPKLDSKPNPKAEKRKNAEFVRYVNP